MVKKCPECKVELIEIDTVDGKKLQCEICGYISGETDEERYSREKAHREKHLNRNQ